MPAARLPWIKFWPELVDHAKFVDLTDSERWTWIEVWAKASQQPERWKFASVAHAQKVTGRKEKDIRKLIEVRLIDERSDGLYIHNARKWQDRYPSDESAKSSPTSPEPHPNGTVKTPRTLLEDSANVTAMLGEDSDKSKREKREEDIDEDVPPAATQRPPQGDQRPRASAVTDEFRTELEEQFWEQCGGREAVRDSIAAGMGYRKRSNYTDQRAFLRNWVRTDAERSESRRGKYRASPVPIRGRVAQADLDELSPGEIA